MQASVPLISPSNTTHDQLPAHWLEPLPLPGGKSLPSRIIPGPMEGVMGHPFCHTMAKQSLVRCWLTPFIRISTGVPRPSRLTHRLEPFTATNLPVMAQIMGTDIAKLRDSARRLADLGVAGIDLNCACPSKIVVGNGAGGARLKNPNWIHEAVGAIRQACPDCGVSVKLRTGFDSPREMDEILAAARSANPDLVILHFRTVAEQYRKVPDGWTRLARAKELLPDIPLFASGDLFSPSHALDLYRQTGVDGIAPARGLLKNPWLLRDIECACQGKPVQEHTDTDKLAFLQTLATAGLQEGVIKSGFVVEFAANLLGSSHPTFQTLVRHRNLRDLCEYLESLNAHFRLA